MSNLFEPSKRESAVDIVVNSIKQLLIDRRLKPGDKLPSELEISEGLGVSRGSVREAMKILSAFGLIDIRVGNGTYVCETPGNGMLDSFLFSFFASNPDIQNLYELRHVFEIDILELILVHYDENSKERKALRNNVDALEEMMMTGANPQQLIENDLEFHRLLGKAAHNLLIERIYNFIIDFMEPSIASTHKKQHGENVYDVHKKIIDIIDAKDSSRIEEAITFSVGTWSLLQSPENTDE
ncbi:MAG: FadR family transcriptional regulator [Ruminococcus sp.]|nr:FadR family transcriptional regulator [Ruminococcus sp.]